MRRRGQRWHARNRNDGICRLHAGWRLSSHETESRSKHHMPGMSGPYSERQAQWRVSFAVRPGLHLCDAACCSALQCVAVGCSVWQCVWVGPWHILLGGFCVRTKLQHSATHCNTMQRQTVRQCNALEHIATATLATHCSTLQYIAAACKTPQYGWAARVHRRNGSSETRCKSLQHTATHCNTLRHTATHCNTLQHG